MIQKILYVKCRGITDSKSVFVIVNLLRDERKDGITAFMLATSLFLGDMNTFLFTPIVIQ